MTKCYCNKYFVSKFVFIGLRVHFDKVFIGQVFYKTAWQILVGIRQFAKQSVSDYLGQAVLWNRVSESHWDKLRLLTESESNFILRVKTHSENDGRLAVWFSTLNNIPPKPGYAVSQSFQFYFCYLTMVGSTTRRKVRPSGKDKSFQVMLMLATLWPEPVNLASFTGKVMHSRHAFT